MNEFVCCSGCFQDEGLRLDAEFLGYEEESSCPNCGEVRGRKLCKDLLRYVAYRFFVWGTTERTTFGAAPMVVFNRAQVTNIAVHSWLEPDLRLIEEKLGVGFFLYAPATWRVGCIEPLEALTDPATRGPVISRILSCYPSVLLGSDQSFYRVRKNLANRDDFSEYDSPPRGFAGAGRLDSADLPVMYASQDLQVCLHECRIAAEDDISVATLTPTRNLRLLDLTKLLLEDDITTPFESLDMAIHMLFLAGDHSYDITREIARSAHAEGYHGILYPSYFSLLRTGRMPFETAYGISIRQFPGAADYERTQAVSNLALFGRPLERDVVRIRAINRVILRRVDYSVHFGPASVQPKGDS